MGDQTIQISLFALPFLEHLANDVKRRADEFDDDDMRDLALFAQHLIGEAIAAGAEAIVDPSMQPDYLSAWLQAHRYCVANLISEPEPK